MRATILRDGKIEHLPCGESHNRFNGSANHDPAAPASLESRELDARRKTRWKGNIMNETTSTTTLTELTDADPILDHFVTELMWAGRNDGPQLLWSWWQSGEMPSHVFKTLVPHVWSLAEWPSRALLARDWLGMFKDAGFVSDCGSSAPTEPVVVYRGAVQSNIRGFSWTMDLERATWFARREELFGFGEGKVFRVTAPPHAVLGHFLDRCEDEIVLNPLCLKGGATPQAVPRESWSETPFLKA
jgi:hypothetical protein